MEEKNDETKKDVEVKTEDISKEKFKQQNETKNKKEEKKQKKEKLKEEKKEKNKKSHKKIWIISIVLFIIICAAISIGLFIKNRENLTEENKETEETVEVKEKEGMGYIAPLEENDIVELKDKTAKIVSTELIITFTEDTSSEEAIKIIEKYDGEIVGELYFLNQYQVKFKEDGEEILNAKKEELQKEKAVKSVIYNYINEEEINENKVGSAGLGEIHFDKDYHMNELGINKAYEIVNPQENINVGIIDSPIYYSHKDLQIKQEDIHFLTSKNFETIDNVLTYYESYNHDNDEENKSKYHTFGGGCSYLSFRSHGTHVAGIISATRNNGIGIDGVNDHVNLHYATPWYYFKNENADGRFTHISTTFSYAYALSSLIMDDCKVINMSIGHTLTDGVMKEDEIYKEYKEYFDDFFATIEKTGKDFLIVKSAGNDATNLELDVITTVFKENEFANNHFIVVGAAKRPYTTDIGDGGLGEIFNFSYKKTTYSNYGSYVDIFALGDVYSTIYKDEYEWMQGTSQAAPIVTGIASLVYQANPNLSASQVKQILLANTKNYVSCDERAVGVVNAENAVNAAKNFNASAQIQEPSEIGLVKGTVKNSSNEVVESNVLIYFKNIQTNETTCAEMEEGNYEVFLFDGTYDIEARIDGYLRFEKKNVTINHSKITVCNIVISDEPLDNTEDEIENNQETTNDTETNTTNEETSNKQPNAKISSRYEIIKERHLTWEEAKEKCEKAGGHLVTITSQEEMDYIKQTLQLGSGRYWIGAYREDKSNWKWVTGEEWNYTNWSEGEPNDSSNVISNENRVVTWGNGEWNDLNEKNTGEQNGYICEWE